MADLQLPISELVIRAKREYNLSWSEMAKELGRSPRMLRKLANGESAGENYRVALTELYERGRVITMTPRHRNKDGSLTKVRSKSGSDSPSVVPQDTRGKRVTGQVFNRYQSHPTQYLGGGGKIDRTDIPSSDRSPYRQEAWDTVGGKIRRAAKSQAHHDRRVKFTATVEVSPGEYRTVTIGSKGGFLASDVNSDIRDLHGGYVQDWFDYQISKIYPDWDVTVVSVEQIEYNATRSKQIRKMQDETNTRRGPGKITWSALKNL